MCKIIMFFLSISFIMAACNSKKRNQTQVAQMNFNVADSLLGDVISDTTKRFFMKTPKWFDKTLIAKEQQTEIKKAGLKLVYSSQSKNTGSAFVVLDLNKLNDSLFNQYNSYLKKSLEQNKQYKKFGIDTFYSNNILFIQYFSLSDSSVNLKLLTTNYLKGHYEIDFSIPSYAYNSQSKMVESVLGSIK